MRRIFNEQIKTNVEIKAEKESVSSSLNNDRRELEIVKQRIEDNNKIALKQKDDFDSKEKLIEKIDKVFIDKSNEIVDLNKDIHKKKNELHTLDIKKENKEKEIKKEHELLSITLDKELINIKNKLTVVESEIDISKKEVQQNNACIIIGDRKLKSINDEIEYKENIIIKELNNNINKKESISIDLINKNDKLINDFQKNIKIDIELDNKIVKNNKELSIKKEEIENIDKIKQSKLEDVNKSESVVMIKEKDLDIKENFLNMKEKEIRKMGNTLQKHFDNNDMKHIKVFE